MNLATTHANALAAPASPHPWLDKTQYPFATRSFRTEHGRMSYVDEGAGPPVLFVHGTPSWSFEWREVIAKLSPARRCVAPDHLGFGLSDKPAREANAPLTPADHAARLRALVEALDLRDITLVVHDFGGPIGLPVALEMPERVARVVVVNTWMWSHGEDPAIARLDRVIRSWVGRVLYRWLNFSPRVLLPSFFADRRKLTRAVHRHYLAPFGARREREAPYALACALKGADPYYAALWSRRESLTRVPLDIVWGEKDKAFTDAHLKRWIEAFPHARVTRVADAGHFVAEENPQSIVEVLQRG